VRPDDDRVVVLPGNHDVQRGSSPSTQERYDNFAKYIRSEGFVCALLDKYPRKGAPPHLLVDEDKGWVIVPINSANWCQQIHGLAETPDALWDELVSRLRGEVSDDAAKQLADLRLNDVARVSHEQLEELRESLEAKADPGLLRIAGLHHHLLPVSAEEEFKAYESITNLGLLRQFFRTNGIRLVLHGHKHTSAVYWDHVPRPVEEHALPAHRVLVVSGSTISTGDAGQREACRLLEVQARSATPAITVTRVPGTFAGTTANAVDLGTYPLWPMPAEDELEAATASLVSGRTADEVYARLMAAIGNRAPTQRVRTMICQIEDGQSANRLPSSYPTVKGAETVGEKQEWLDELVSWWQHRRRVRDPEDESIEARRVFTHGDRICARAGVSPGQEPKNRLDRALDALSSELLNSGRAIVVLIDPDLDLVDDPDLDFPAFCSVQFLLSDDYRVDCVAYFRNQEMRYWWAVNMAEVAQLQAKIAERLMVEASCGFITSVSALASVAKSGAEPGVAVPLVDRLADESPERLADLAYGVVGTAHPTRKTWRALWEDVLTDLTPSVAPVRKGVPIAIHGLLDLLNLLKHLSVTCEKAKPIAERVEMILGANRAHAAVVSPSRQKHVAWRQQVIGHVDALRKLIAEVR
jgi:hypothetical protein